jgi:hypothetical protein
VLCMTETGKDSGQFAVADRPRMISMHLLKKLRFYITVLAPDLQTKPLSCFGVNGETGIKQSTREIFLTV